MLDKPRPGYYILSNNNKVVIERILNNDQDLLNGTKKTDKDANLIFPMCYSILKIWMNQGSRQIYPDLDAAQICLGSKLLENLTYEDVLGIFESFVINVPRNLIVSKEYGALNFVIVNFGGHIIIPKGTDLAIVAQMQQGISKQDIKDYNVLGRLWATSFKLQF